MSTAAKKAAPAIITLTTIESEADFYSALYGDLADRIKALDEEIAEIKRRAMPGIRAVAAKVREAEACLAEAIKGAPELFAKPRTRTLHGIKVGYTKQRGSVNFDTEEKVIARIRAQLPKDQVELLLRVETHVHKPAVYDLTAADLKRLGIRITDDCDVVVVKPVGTDVMRAVAALLDSAAGADEERAA